jgi:hypothetical protein
MTGLALACAAGLLVIAGFQVALALGAPLGRAAWGGRTDRLPARLRVASAVAAVLWVVAAVVVLDHAGIGPGLVPPSVTSWAIWLLAGLLAVGAVVNLASSSRWERFGWAPISALLAIGCGALAAGGPPAGS